MTLTAAWLRRTHSSQELVFAADSRLSGGETWDRGPKIFELPRSDGLVSFAGDTYFALPAVLQMIQSIAAYPPSVRRSSDLEVAVGHCLRVLDEIYKDRRDFSSDGDPGPGASLTIGGWSWRAGKFRIWHVTWDKASRRFRSRPVRARSSRSGVQCWFAGDADAVHDARLGLDRLLDERELPPDKGLDLEPLELIARAIRSEAYRGVGGAPQVAKVYQHMNTQQFAVQWQPRGGPSRLYMAGRPLLSYEVAHVPTIRADWLAPLS